ncbi:MetQ/NlpA family ABC transporter substrate-binding protein [Paenalkalicoccus suaedae]|uniref:Lipoprotein n=1 Tax=Paenalkalicoccus suaedae TaxID=2592382 RepID=A0A859FAP4_9BACI|nr:MetQ/NlpA family ABC transporter substrate-binding protein [Paenalkalicoccus suaedae]QKS70000.1 MetQ/NlpA family ABC transporter substrate-binding protein [Paenalkalicoccus suaedae]
MRKAAFLTGALTLLLVACGESQASEDRIEVSIGVTGADGQFWNLISDRAAEEGIDIELIEFADYALPNTALVNGEIDLNSFQHLAFLSQYNAEYDETITPIGSTVIAPLGLYSTNHESIEDIPDGGEIALPNDPANTGRGLKVLESAGLITLREDVGLYPTVDDIEENPKNLEFVLVVAQQTPRVLPDVAGSIINSGIATQADIFLDEALVHDDPYSDEAAPYINVFATRAEEKDNEAYHTIAQIYQEEDIAQAVVDDSNGGNIVVDIPQEDLQQTLDELVQNLKEGQ